MFQRGPVEVISNGGVCVLEESDHLFWTKSKNSCRPSGLRCRLFVQRHRQRIAYVFLKALIWSANLIWFWNRWSQNRLLYLNCVLACCPSFALELLVDELVEHYVSDRSLTWLDAIGGWCWYIADRLLFHPFASGVPLLLLHLIGQTGIQTQVSS